MLCISCFFRGEGNYHDYWAAEDYSAFHDPVAKIDHPVPAVLAVVPVVVPVVVLADRAVPVREVPMFFAIPVQRQSIFLLLPSALGSKGL